MEKTIMKFIELTKQQMPIAEIIKQADIRPYIKHNKNFAYIYKKALQEYDLKNKVYQYMITFTISDKANIDLKNEDQLLSLEKTILKYFTKNKLSKSLIRVFYVREGNKHDGKRPHWHFSVQSRVTITAKNTFKNYINTIGNIDISKSTVKTCKNALDYFSNDIKMSQYKPIIKELYY